MWSPDGKKIAFDTDRGDADPDNDPAINDIFTTNTDESDLRNLTGSKGFALAAGWSPDSKTIAPIEVTTDRASVYPRYWTLVPSALHTFEQYANNPVEADHGRLKACEVPKLGRGS